MSEKDIERVEGKINLLYRIFMNPIWRYGSDSPDYHLKDYVTELAELFEIFPEKKILKDLPDQGDVDKKIQELIDIEAQLKKDQEEGNFLVKDKKKVEIKINNLKEGLLICKEIKEIGKKIELWNAKIYEIRLFEGLNKKLCIEQKSDPEEKNLLGRIDDALQNLGELKMRLEENENYRKKIKFSA